MSSFWMLASNLLSKVSMMPLVLWLGFFMTRPAVLHTRWLRAIAQVMNSLLTSLAHLSVCSPSGQMRVYNMPI